MIRRRIEGTDLIWMMSVHMPYDDVRMSRMSEACPMSAICPHGVRAYVTDVGTEQMGQCGPMCGISTEDIHDHDVRGEIMRMLIISSSA